MARTSKASKTPTSKASKATKKQAPAKKATSNKTAAKRAAAKTTTRKATSSSVTTKKASAKASTTKKESAKASTTKAATKKPAVTKAATKKAVTKKAVPKKAVTKKAKSPFDTRFLEQMRKLLKTERDTYERQAAQLKAEADSLVADMDPGDVQFDEESGEGDTIAVERGRDLALAAKALEMIEEIDHANAKFDLGTYGICEISEEPIPRERLEAIPWAREKVEYKVGGFGRR